MEPETPAAYDRDPAIQGQMILLAASHHDLESLRTLLRTGSASVQNPETGFTPLHAAIAACDPLQRENQANGIHNGDHGNESIGKEDIERSAGETVKLLLQRGAIWNDVDKNDETPGCLALKLGSIELYSIMVDAGVRAEMLLNRLDEYEMLKDQNSTDEAEDDAINDQVDQDENATVSGYDEYRTENPPKPTEQEPQVSSEIPPDAIPNTSNYLRSPVSFSPSRLLDSSTNGVMMSWETPLMRRTAELLCTEPGLKILNIGHGMGIIDSFFQTKPPNQHHIIEAHPSVLSQMRANGWYDKPGVTVHEGKWQDICPKLIEQEIIFDAIYFDTFAEDYNALRTFFSDIVLGLLDEKGSWGFFNGLGADRQICYDVYAKVVEMDLFEAGFEVEWEDLDVPDLEREGEWDGVRRKYWACRQYKLPICRFTG
ncbi:MAG: hypothetical protein LQ351_000916 [Letrouitia transgressa]|nr:MAG: hypothetical protein LQ351_000916 [Letrouitia transgressa]